MTATVVTKAAVCASFVGLLLACPGAGARTRVVLDGTPLFHVVATPDTVTWEAVPQGRRHDFRCLVTRADTSSLYMWTSRENGALFSVQPGGSFVTFLGADGVVRVGDVEAMADGLKGLLPLLQDMPPDQAALTYWDNLFLNSEPMRARRYAYVEILWQGLGVVMYFGVADELDL